MLKSSSLRSPWRPGLTPLALGTLVSVRPNRGKEFGLQIVGRIMRVHPLVRPFHGTDAILDRGYVFLTDPELQAGLNAAVEDLKAVRHGMELITDRLDIVQFGNLNAPMEQSVVVAGMATVAAPQSSEERQERLNLLIKAGLIEPKVAEHSAGDQDRAILAAEMVIRMSETPLFGELPLHHAPTSPNAPIPKDKRYRLRPELSVP